MKDLTVDTGVLMSASGKSDGLYEVESITLTKDMLEKPNVYVVLDRKGLVEQEYKDKIKELDYGRQWLKQMASKDRVKTVDCPAMPKGVRVELEEAHFDPSDRRFVNTCSQSECLCLVAHDDDYSPAVRTILRQSLGISVLSASDATDFVADP